MINIFDCISLRNLIMFITLMYCLWHHFHIDEKLFSRGTLVRRLRLGMDLAEVTFLPERKSHFSQELRIP